MGNIADSIDATQLTAPGDFVKTLEIEGVSYTSDFMYASLDFSSVSSQDLTQSIDYIASRYAVMANQINSNCVGEEKNNKLKALNDMVASTKNDIAKKFSDNIGSFFEENGVTGEKEKIYQSVLSAFDNQIADYADFMEKNTDYAHINGTKDQWLKNDSAYMACELRKAKSVDSNISATNKNDSSYTVDELSKMKDLVCEIKSYSPENLSSKNRVNKWGTEEEIGMQLSQVALKGEVFNKYANVSENVKNIVTKSIGNFIDNAINAVQNNLDTEIKIKGSNIPAEVLNGYGALDKNAIYGVINKVKSTYESTEDVQEALFSGAKLAHRENTGKIQDSKFTQLYRYKHSTYWNNFYESSNKIDDEPDILGFYKPNAEPEINNIINSWNNFVKGFTVDESVQLKFNHYSIYA